jgi:hypothetical protein
MERREPYNQVLEASIGYAALCSVAVMDEVAIVNEKVDGLVNKMDVVDERVGELNGRVLTLTDELAAVKYKHHQLELALEAERQARRALDRSLVSWP